MAHVDSQEIKQVVLNLVVNALDSMERDGHAADRAAVQPRAWPRWSSPTTAAECPPTVLENIFEPFFTKRRVGKGTGLGLSITHRIVSQHHGEIMATSPGEDQGSTFTVRLPDPTDGGRSFRIDEPPRRGVDSAPAVSHRAGERRASRPLRDPRSLTEETSAMEKTHQGGLRILFADDEAHLRDLMQMELPRLGHEVTVCPDGAAALKALEKGRTTPRCSTCECPE